jgi:hypothetical protein
MQVGIILSLSAAVVMAQQGYPNNGQYYQGNPNNGQWQNGQNNGQWNPNNGQWQNGNPNNFQGNPNYQGGPNGGQWGPNNGMYRASASSITASAALPVLLMACLM